MIKKRLLLSSILLFVGACTGGGGKMVEVTRFSPPTSVEVKPAARALVVSWKASPDEPEKDFAGYNVYVSTNSLLLSSKNDLPAPVEVNKGTHSVTVKNLETGKVYFVHVRSRRKNGEVSVPSLPEVVGRPE
jgi:hypothetical protein